MDDKLIEAIFGPGKTEFKRGDKVLLPSWKRISQRQGRVNIVLGVYPKKGYIFMAKMLRNGKVSSDRRAAIYWHYDRASSLRKVE